MSDHMLHPEAAYRSYRMAMDRRELMERAQAARARAGKLTAATLRQQVHDDVGAEMAAEQATTLVRLGQRLDQALATLVELEASCATAKGDARASICELHATVRKDLLDARWEMTVVREAMGLRGVRRDLDETWPVPPPLTS